MTINGYWIQAINTNASDIRTLTAGLILESLTDGVYFQPSSPLAVTAQASPNGTVKVAAGWGKASTYVGYNSASANVDILGSHPADPSNPRIDLVVMRFYDATQGDGSDQCVLEQVVGTPGASPSAPATPARSVKFAEVTVAAGATTITSGAISDKRALFVPPGVTARVASQAERDSLTKYNGLRVYRLDKNRPETCDGTLWHFKQSGSFTSTFTAANATSGTLNFTDAFDSTPNGISFMVKAGSNRDVCWNLQTLTTSAAGWRLFQKDGGTFTDTVTVYWSAEN